MYSNSFYVESADVRAVASVLRQWTGTQRWRLESPPEWLYKERAAGTANGRTFYVFRAAENWCGVDHSLTGPLHSWGERLSTQFGGRFVQLRHRDLSLEDGEEYLQHAESDEYSYLLVYDRGEKIREIEAYSEEAHPIKDQGKKFPFEEPVIHGPAAIKAWSPGEPFWRIEGSAFEVYNIFTETTLMYFCEQFGFHYAYSVVDEATAEERILMSDYGFTANIKHLCSHWLHKRKISR